MILQKTERPPYRIPLMSEIAETPPNGLSFVSTFSGCGGSCLGFEMDGWRPLLASEFIPAAQDVYRLNHPGVPLLVDDVRTVEPELVLAYLGLDQGELDLFEGSPPCASFSTAGKRDAGWGNVRKYSDGSQRVDDLFFEYVRLLRGLRPKTFVAENVTGLVKGVAKGYFKEIHRQLTESGYRVSAMMLDAQWLGVPQARQRIIFAGVRSDLALDPPVVQPLPYRYTVRDAIPLAVRHGTAPPHADWTEADRSVEATMVDSADNAAPTIVASGDNKGAGWVEVRVPVAVHHDRGPSWGNAGDVSDTACPTITIGVGSLNSYHYQVEEEVLRAGGVPETERRKFTIPELKRISAFPDDFQLTGTYQQQWERLGRAVPPPMMRAVARAMREQVLDR